MKSAVSQDLIARWPLFQGLHTNELSTLCEAFSHEYAVSGDEIMRQGAPADCLFLVLSGRLQILVSTEDPGEHVIGEAGRGEIVGEMGILTDAPRSASVRAARDTELARLSREDFSKLIEEHPSIMKHIAQMLVERARVKPTSSYGALFCTLAVIPAGPQAPDPATIETLVAALRKAGTVLHLNREAFAEALGESAVLDDVDEWDETDSQIADWLTDQEQAHDFIVFEADADPTPWTRRCLRQADRILLVGHAAEQPTMSSVERLVISQDSDERPKPVELMLVHDPDASDPSGTARWLETRHVMRHHHVRAGREADFERVGRFLTNRAVGIVLGGGGARGAAHYGALRALSDAGVPIDIIGGTSSGAAVAAQFAQGQTFQEMRDLNHELWVKGNPFRKWTLPLVSLVSQTTTDKLASSMYGDQRIEDLWIPFFCVSCNLSSGDTVVHRSGSLARAVRATTAIPGVFAPLVEDTHLLVDGGVVDNLPVDVMKDLSPGPTVAVNVSPDVDLVISDGAKRLPSDWEILRSRLSPFRNPLRVPSLLSILRRVALVNRVARQRQTHALADFFLEPPVEGFGMVTPGDLDELIDIGYEYTAEQIARWRRDPMSASRLLLDHKPS